MVDNVLAVYQSQDEKVSLKMRMGVYSYLVAFTARTRGFPLDYQSQNEIHRFLA